MAASNESLQKAVSFVLSGDWEAAHHLVQQFEEDPLAAWIHAVLHKMEGDSTNSRYWYRRAQRMDRVTDEALAELKAIQQELRSSASSGGS